MSRSHYRCVDVVVAFALELLLLLQKHSRLLLARHGLKAAWTIVKVGFSVVPRLLRVVVRGKKLVVLGMLLVRVMR